MNFKKIYEENRLREGKRKLCINSKKDLML